MEVIKPQRKILRSPSVKRRSKVLPVNQRVKLERVLGVTVTSNSCLDCDSNNGTIAYPAGCVTVLFNPQRNKQTHIFNVCRKTISAVSFSRDGKYIVTGENGHQPAVRIWDVEEKTQVAELLGHKFGINCVTFSPNSKEVVSVGTQHDMMVIVWNWKSGNKVATNKVSSKVSAIAFSEDGKCFVTVGSRHVRFWYLEDRRSKINQTVPLAGRSGILGDQKDNFFCDIACGKGKASDRFFVITQAGLLCEFNEKRLLDKWVELKTKSASCITAGTEHIFVGCSEGTVLVFSAINLHYLCTLPKPHHLGVEITTATTANHMVSGRKDACYPDTKCIAFDDDHKKVTCVYNDRSIYIWDVHDIKRVGKAWSFLYHSGCIWTLEVYPPLEEGVEAMLPPGSFLTGSHDDTIRVWNLNTHMPENTAYKRNIYSNELVKIVYSDPALTCLTETDYNPAGGTDKTDTKYDDKSGVRSIRVSPEGTHLASGDRQGNLRIYDMKYLNEIRSVEAHDSDVMCLEYSYTPYGKFLATASRDRLIHVFDVEANYGLVQTLGDHSSSITAVRFTDNNDKLGMISCGADKSILIRNAVTTPEFQFQLEHHLATKLTLYDMIIDPTQKYLATACQDRNVRMYNIDSRKEKKCYRGSVGEDGILLRIHLDPSGSFAATACTDKSVCILDFATGELVASMYGHSETITGVKFANDLKHLITVSADGCIFVWRLPSEMTTQMKGRLLDLGKAMSDTDCLRSDNHMMMPNPVSLSSSSFDGALTVMKAASVANIPMLDDNSAYSHDGGDDGDNDDEVDHDHLGVLKGRKLSEESVSAASLAYRFSIGQLPNWAKAKYGEGGSEGSESSQEMAPPKGRWAQRVDHKLEFKSQPDITSDDETQPDRRRVNQLSDARRQKAASGKQTRGKGMPIIGDDLRASTGDLSSLSKRDFSTPTRSDTFIHSRQDSSLKKLTGQFDFLKGDSLELDDGDDLDTGSDTTEVIYPPAETDSDVFASSYQIFAAEEAKKSKSRLSSTGVANMDDVTSESTDPTSLEEEEEGAVVSYPNTPSSDPDKEFLPWDAHKEDFVKENFEEDFSPAVFEQFQKTEEGMEKNLSDKGSVSVAPDSTPFSPRLSLSARFMSRAQPKPNSSIPGGYRQDNWFSRNKMEMSRAMDETRKSLLAMNFRSGSPEELEEQSPPVKMDRNSFKTGLYATPQPAGAQREDQKPELSRLNTSGPLAKRINKEKERRRSSSSKAPTDPPPSSESTTTTKPVARPRPSYFKTTQSSRNRVSRDLDKDSSASTSSTSSDAPRRKSFGKESSRMPSSKLSLYASTPNLVLGFNDNEEEQPPVGVPSRNLSKTKTAKMKSMSNLKALADLSRSVPAVNESDTDSSSGPNQPRPKSVFGCTTNITSRYASGLTAHEKMPPTQATTAVSKRRSTHETRERAKSMSSSEMTLDQAKSILLGKSGVLPAKSSGTATVASVTAKSRTSLSSTSSSGSLQSLPSIMSVADPTLKPTHSSLPVEEEIEHTANMLRHQHQVNTSTTSSSFPPPSHQTNSKEDMEASPLDLPERDGPPIRRSSGMPPSSLASTSSSSTSTSSLHQPALSGMEAASNDGPGGQDNAGKRVQSVRERIGRLDAPNTASKGVPVSTTAAGLMSKPGRTSSPHRRVLPASPLVVSAGTEPPDTAASRVSSDTGLGSESDNMDSVTGHSVGGSNGVVSSSSKADRSKLALPLNSPPSSLEQVRNCKTALDELRSQLSNLKDLFAQVDGRTDESSRVILTMMGQAFHEAQSVIMELASQTPSPSPSFASGAVSSSTSSQSFPLSSSSSSSSSFPSSSSSHGRPSSSGQTFQSSYAIPPQGSTTNGNDDSCSSSSSSTFKLNSTDSPSYIGGLTQHQVAALSATKDILQPLVSQLSVDLSEGILKILRERIDQTSTNGSST